MYDNGVVSKKNANKAYDVSIQMTPIKRPTSEKWIAAAERGLAA